MGDALTQAQAVDPTGSVLLQYGAIGAIALLLAWAVKVLFQRETKSLDLERQRADRLEQELRQLNQAVQDRVMTALNEATATQKSAIEAMRDREDRR